jgi:transcriptional regulator with AAA-type ATPase domain
MPNKDEFFNPLASYQGQQTLGNLVFNANLQEFANRVAIVCALETGGKITAEEAYLEIRSIWKKLKNSKTNLLDHPPVPEE